MSVPESGVLYWEAVPLQQEVNPLVSPNVVAGGQQTIAQLYRRRRAQSCT